jgi:uncharacterized CHY-type Zn-finger protein
MYSTQSILKNDCVIKMTEEKKMWEFWCGGCRKTLTQDNPYVGESCLFCSRTFCYQNKCENKYGDSYMASPYGVNGEKQLFICIDCDKTRPEMENAWS